MVGDDSQLNVQKITVSWPKQNKRNAFILAFELNEKEYALKEIQIQLNGQELPNGRNETIRVYYKGNTFNIPKGMSYHCNKHQILELKDNLTNKTIGNATVSQVQLEAFNEGKTSQFSRAVDCEAINTPDIVPIVVGICLIALVVIVLIVYVVGRRRAQARGYVSM